MKRQLRGTVAFAVCGSFCTLGAAVAQAEQLVRQGWELLPVMSYAASGLNTRFGRADEWKARLETLTGHRVLDTLQDVEPLGPRQLARALVVAPCTGTTLPGWRRAFPTRRSRWRQKACCESGARCCWLSPPTMGWGLPGRTLPG